MSCSPASTPLGTPTRRSTGGRRRRSSSGSRRSRDAQAATGFDGRRRQTRLTHLTAEVSAQPRSACAMPRRSIPPNSPRCLPPLLAAAMQAPSRAATARCNWARGFACPERDADAPAWTQALIAMMRAALAQNAGDADTLGVESERALRDVPRRARRRVGHRVRESDALGVADARRDVSTRRSPSPTLPRRVWPGSPRSADLVQQRCAGMASARRFGRIDEARERRLAETDALADRRLGSRPRAGADAPRRVEIAVGDGRTRCAARRHASPTFARALPTADRGLVGVAARAGAASRIGREEAREALRGAIPVALRSGDQPILADVVLSLAGWLAADGSGCRSPPRAGAVRPVRAASTRPIPGPPHARRLVAAGACRRGVRPRRAARPARPEQAGRRSLRPSTSLAHVGPHGERREDSTITAAPRSEYQRSAPHGPASADRAARGDTRCETGLMAANHCSRGIVSAGTNAFERNVSGNRIEHRDALHARRRCAR